MKHCDNCHRAFDIEEQACHVCVARLRDMTPEETERTDTGLDR